MNSQTAWPAHPALDRQAPSNPGGRESQTACGEWHALYARHQHEQAIAQHLQRMGLQTFLPVLREVHQWSDRRRKVSRPLFPGYLFFAGGLERRLQILNTPGVCSLVMNAGKVGVIPESELEAVRRVVAGMHSVEPHPYLCSGDRIRVCAGSLAGIEGYVARVKDSMRVVISVETLRRSLAVEVDEKAIERIAAA